MMKSTKALLYCFCKLPNTTLCFCRMLWGKWICNSLAGSLFSVHYNEIIKCLKAKLVIVLS